MLRDRKPFHFIKLRKVWYIFSLLLIIPGLISLCTQGLNLGIDFKGGSLLDFRLAQPTAVEQVREVLADFDLAGVSIQRSGETEFLVRTQELTEEQGAAIITSLEEKFGEVTVQRNERVGPTIGQELVRNSLLALVLAGVLMIIYIAWRFELKQGIAAIIALIHDVLIIVGVFSIFQLEIDSKFVAAILAVIGYSINDTIVIFDRIRERLLYRKKGQEIQDVINDSLWQTMARTINTGLTVIFVLAALYVLGGATIQTMVLALMLGIICGAYSSICTASPIWYDLKILTESRKAKPVRV